VNRKRGAGCPPGAAESAPADWPRTCTVRHQSAWEVAARRGWPRRPWWRRWFR